MKKETIKKSVLITNLIIIDITIITVIAIYFISTLQNDQKTEENPEFLRGTIQVFLNKDLTPEQEGNIRKQIETICNTTNIEYVSKKDALKQMEEQLKEQPAILDTFDENIFPASYIVKGIKFSKIPKYKEKILNINGVKKVTSNDETIIAIYTSLLKNPIEIIKEMEDYYEIIHNINTRSREY